MRAPDDCRAAISLAGSVGVLVAVSTTQLREMPFTENLQEAHDFSRGCMTGIPFDSARDRTLAAVPVHLHVVHMHGDKYTRHNKVNHAFVGRSWERPLQK